MKQLVETDQIQALWLGASGVYRSGDDLIAGLIAAIDQLDDDRVADALADVSRVDLALDRLTTRPCDCPDTATEDELVQCPTMKPALAAGGRQMMREACESIRGWNLLYLAGGWVAAGVADDAHYDGAILIGQIDPLADHR